MMSSMGLLKFSILFCMVASSLGVETWNELIVKWDALGWASRVFNNAYFSLPTTASAAKSQDWVEVESDSEYWTIWCLPDDPRISLLMDQQGNFAGMDIGVPPADVSEAPYDYSKHPMYSTVTRFNQTVLKGRFFLVSMDVLKNGGRPNMDEGLGTGLWLQNGESLMEVPITESELESKTLFTRESCIPEMGRHYYYNMTKKLDCGDFEPFFLTTDAVTGVVHGLGFQGFGHGSYLKRNWWEFVPSIAIRPTIPTTPDCLVDWAAKYGVLSMHVYFRSKPWTIGCGGLFGTGLLA